MTLTTNLFLWLLVPIALMVLLALFGRVPIRYNLRNLAVRWPITLLTATVFVLVIGLMMVMLAFVNGVYRLTISSAKPGNVLVLSDGATDELFSNLSYRDVHKIEEHPAVLHAEDGRP